MKRINRNSEEWSQKSVREGGDDAWIDKRVTSNYSCSHSVSLLVATQTQTAFSLVTLTRNHLLTKIINHLLKKNHTLNVRNICFSTICVIYLKKQYIEICLIFSFLARNRYNSFFLEDFQTGLALSMFPTKFLSIHSPQQYKFMRTNMYMLRFDINNLKNESKKASCSFKTRKDMHMIVCRKRW